MNKKRYNLPSIISNLNNSITTHIDLLKKLKTNITKYNEKHQTKIDFANLFLQAKEPLPQQESPQQPTPIKLSSPNPTEPNNIPQFTPSAEDLPLPKIIPKKSLTISSDTANENSVIDISTLKPPEGMKCAKQAFLYSYCAQDSVEGTSAGDNRTHVDDFGWGCAWRAIQTCLSSLVGKNKVPHFENLYYFYGQEQKLKELYKDKHGKELNFTGGKNAPHAIRSGWAEPFIGEMVLHGYGYNADLFTLNNIPGANSPDEVFQNKQKESLSFNDFRTKLDKHFSKETPAPVMIDNGIYAMNIIGCRLNSGGTTTLWISDTHLVGGSTKPGSTKPIGVYSVNLSAQGSRNSFDSHDSTNLTELPQNIKEQMLSKGKSSKVLDFSSTCSWMVLFPGEKREKQ